MTDLQRDRANAINERLIIHHTGKESEAAKMNDKSISAVREGMTFGSVIAVTISWSINHSVPWAIIHGFFGWFYVIYYLATRP